MDRRWPLQVAISFGCKTRRLLGDVVPREEQGTWNRREETVTGTGTGAEKGIRTGTRTGVETGTRIERRVDGRDSLGTY